MAFKLADRVRETSTTTGPGSLTLAGAAVGYQSFNDALDDGDTTWYAIVLGTSWEVGVGTFASPSTLARSSILASSNGGAAVSFGAGEKDVFVTAPASELILLQKISSFFEGLLDDGDAATLLTSLGVSSFIQAMLNDADAATARTTLGANGNGSDIFTGATGIGKLLGIAADEASGRAAIAAPAAPQSGSGAGQFIPLATGAGSPVVLPSGGTWAYSAIAYDASTLAIGSAQIAGVGAGGATVQAGVTNKVWYGSTWRIA